MRTTIVIDDHLVADAMLAAGVTTKREAIELGLQTLVRLARQRDIRRHRGTLPSAGDLDAMRAES